MSGFREAFTKESSGSSLLNYDDTASLFFAGTVLLMILVPWTRHFLVYRLISPGVRLMRKRYPKTTLTGSTRLYCACSSCDSRMKNDADECRRWENRLDTGFFLHAIGLAVMWIVFLYILTLCLTTPGQVAAFDPFTILGITSTADDKQIKKAYRQMSLRLHPDKNPNDKQAAAMFMMVAKAYNALTDEVAKKNYEKYGNPDGPGVMKVGIGLPQFLVEESNQVFFLIFFFMILLMFIPIAFIAHYERTKRITASGVRVETLQFLSYYMNDKTRSSEIAEFLAASAEARQLKMRPSDSTCISKIMKSVQETRKREFQSPVIVRNYYLILAHLQRKHYLLTRELRETLNAVLRSTMLVTQSMMELSFLNNWLGTIREVLEFRRSLIQALDLTGAGGSPLLQIPHLTPEHISRLSEGTQRFDNSSRLLQLLKARDSGSGPLAAAVNDVLKSLTPSERADVQAFLQHCPRMDLEASIVSDEDDEDSVLVPGDIATCTVKLLRTNLKQGEAAGPVHAPLFIDTKFEEWWIFISDKVSGVVWSFKRCRTPEQSIEEMIQFPVRDTGKFTLVVQVLCDAYSGLDVTTEVPYEVKRQEQVMRQVFVHPEDAALDDEPTLLQHMLGDMIPGQSSSSSEDEGTDDEAEEEDLPAPPSVEKENNAQSVSQKNDHVSRKNSLPKRKRSNK